MRMNEIDRKILAELQNNGRISVTDLGNKVGLSLSPCHRRVRALEDGGVITGYRAVLSPAAVGLNFSAIVFVTLQETGREYVQAFEDALLDVPEITSAQRLFGDPDYILNLLTCDIDAFRQLYDRTLSSLPGVARLKSTLVMKDIVRERPIAL